MSSRPLKLLALTLLALFLAVAAAPRLSAGPAAGPAPTFSLHTTIDSPTSFAGAFRPLYDPVKNRLYFAHHQYATVAKLTTIDLSAGRVISSQAIGVFTVIGLSPDGSRLYAEIPPRIGAENAQIVTVDTTNFQVVRRFAFDCALGERCALIAGAVGPAGRLYLAAYGDNHVDVRDPDTGTLLHRLALDTNMNGLSGLAIYEDKLFLVENSRQADHSENPDLELHRYDISAVVPALELSVTTTTPNTTDWRMSAGGRYLIGGIQLFDPVTLKLVTTPDTGTEHFRGHDISRDEKSIIVAQGDMYDMALREYDIATGAVLRETDLDYYGSAAIPFEQVAALSNDRLALLFGDVVRLYSPGDYFTLMPAALAGFCGRPFLDDFSDPTSGWPIHDDGVTLRRYDNGEYGIFQRPADVWSAVSRGDAWVNWRAAGVRAWIPAGHGMLGLIFGLNADWTSFYTFEIAPNQQRWLVFRYTNGEWELLGSDVNPHIYASGASNSLQLDSTTPDAPTFLRVNGYPVFQVPAIPPGRVGLSAGSFTPNVDLRFDDYYFAGPYCPLPGERRAGVEVAPPITRPPLETFLP